MHDFDSEKIYKPLIELSSDMQIPMADHLAAPPFPCDIQISMIPVASICAVPEVIPDCSPPNLEGSSHTLANKTLQVQAEESLPARSAQCVIRSANKPIFIELCSGSARLSLHMQKLGCHVIPVDHKRNDHKSLVPAVILDLSDKSQCKIILDLLDSGNVACISAGIPCGTSSRAREIALPGGGGPRPLRSAEFLLGLPGLSKLDQLKVDKANAIYHNVSEILDKAILLMVLILLENPRGSWVWLFPWFLALLSRGFFDVDFQHCKWNDDETPSRPKWTRLRTNIKQLAALAGVCTRKHLHLGWGQKQGGGFATADEAEYSENMCNVVSNKIAEGLVDAGWIFTPESANADLSSASPHKKRRAAMGRQPRGHALPAVISEFGSICSISNNLISADCKDYKVLRRGAERGDPAAQETIVGRFRSPEAFLEEAKKAQHPANIQGAIPDELCHAIHSMLESSPACYANRMLDGIRELTKLVSDNVLLDAKAFEQVDKMGQRVLAGKKLHSQGLLCARFRKDDIHLGDDFRHGFKIVGMQPFSGVFEHEVRLPSCATDSLRSNSSTSNAAIMARVKSCGNPKVDKELWDICKEETDKGWLVGPFADCAAASEFLHDYPHLSRRFPLIQGSKLRPIDDLTEPGTNSAFGCQDRIQFLDTDSMCAVIRLLERILCDGLDTIVLRDGTILKLTVHREWVSSPDAKAWRGKNFDLKKAYKQLMVHPCDRWASTIATFNPENNSCSLFAQVTLPFGGSGSVLGFNRTATFLWSLGVQQLGVLWTNFYDDYPAFAPQCVAKTVQNGVELMFQILGWKLSREPDKAFDFAASFSSLGIVFNVGRIILKDSSVNNKPDRVNRVVKEFQQVLKEGSFSPALSDSLRGKVQFMEASIFGRAGKAVITLFQRHSRGSYALSDLDSYLITWLCEWVSNVLPRSISPKFEGPPLLLFTDGACEFKGPSRILTFGALLYDPRDGALLYYGDSVIPQLELEWSESGRKQLVTEAELLPQLISRLLWPGRFRSANVLSFLDSEPSKFACIKGSSDSPCCEDIVRSIHQVDAELMPWIWYSRVPTFSNPSDAASRLDWDLMARLFPKGIRVSVSGLQPISLKRRPGLKFLQG